MQEPRKQLLDLGLSDSEVTVYLAMVSGARTARDLVKTTRLKRPTVYYALGCLEKRGLARRSGVAGDTQVVLEPAERLVTIAKAKALEMSQLQKRIEELVPVFAVAAKPSDARPSVAFYEGVDAVKGAIMEMLCCKSKQMCSIVPKENFFWQVGRDFVELFVEERMRRHIKTKNLWEDPIDRRLIRQYYEGRAEVRILPEVMHGAFHTTIFIFDNKTLYVSSKNNSYCVLITSDEHAETMRALFNGLWSTSKPHDR